MQTTSSATSSEPSPWSRRTAPLVAWLAVTALLVAIAFAGARGRGAGTPSDLLFRYEFAAVSLVYVVLSLVTWGIARGFDDPARAVGFRAVPLRWIGIALGLAFLSVLVSAALEPILHAGREQGLAPAEWRDDRTLAFGVNAFVIVAVVPFAEELFFRGLGVRVLGFLGALAAVGGTALAFALAHGLLVGIPALGFFGLALGWVRWRTDSVWPGVVAHSAYNLVGILVAVYFALNPDQRPQAVAGFF